MTEATAKGSGRHWGIVLPAVALGALVILYSVYWFAVADEVRKSVEAFSARGEEGLVTGWEDFSVGGYPYRIEARFETPAASAPETPEAWEWRGERAAVALLPYNLRHAVLTLGGEQVLRYRDVRTASQAASELRAKAETARASYVDLPESPFGRLAIDIENLDAAHRRGATGAEDNIVAGRLQLHTRPALDETGAPVPASYDIAVQADSIAVDGAERVPALGNGMELLLIQARLRDVPQTAHVSAVELLQAWRANGGTLALSDLIVKWGPLDLTASGELALDTQNRLEGQLDARVTDFDGLLKAMVRDGVVKEDEARIALAGLVLVSQFQGNRSDEVRVPVIMREGRLFLGPLAIAKLEPLY
ncbi:DUF2125 domain-containing protein [Parvibaculum sp.]|jgi:hypothetical protein|uniref:DUF2125 domain-containing protein n=1 Tax=Parvibaculum sp. TaxID=2024848 RepID=UPI002FDA963E